MKYYIGSRHYEGYEPCTIEFAVEFLRKQEVVGVDIETTKNQEFKDVYSPVYKFGLDPYLSNIIMLQIGTLDTRFVIDVRDSDITPFVEIFENPAILKVGANLKFEGKFFLHHLKCRLVNVWDVMIAEKILYNGELQGYSLEALMIKYLGKQSLQQYDLFSQLDNTDISKKVEVLRDQYFLAGKDVSTEELQEEAFNEILDTKYINKSIRLGFVHLKDKPFTLEMLDYGDEDIVAPLQIYEIQKRGRIVDGYLYNPINGFELENPITQVLAELEVIGVPFDESVWMAAYEHQLTIYEKRLKQINQYIIDNHPAFCGPLDMFTNSASCAIQWSSPKQVIHFYQSLDACPVEKSKSTGKQSPTVGAKALFNTLTNEHKKNFYKNSDIEEIKTLKDFTLMYLLFKKSEQLITTFGKDWLKYVHPVTKRVHSNFNQYMISSRFSSNNPNLQQIPGSDEYRAAFAGNLINADYSAQEVRVAAEVHGVAKMIDFFVNGDEIFGDDFHSWTATNVFRIIYNDPNLIIKKETHPDERDKSKATTFRLQYGGSVFSLMLEFNLTEEEAVDFLRSYFDAFPGLEESMEAKKEEAVNRGWIRLDDYTDKRYFYPDYNEMNRAKERATELLGPKFREMNQVEREKHKEKLRQTTDYSQLWKTYFILRGKLERRSLNLPIQGASATMIKRAMLLLYNYRWENNLQNDLRLLLPVHDELLLDYQNAEKANDYSLLVTDKMSEAGKIICSQIPMVAAAKITKFWKH